MSDKKCCNKASIGGQAVIEGIMMKGPKKTVLAVRHIKTGEIIIEDVKDKKSENKFLKLPFIRGVYNFVLAMIVGYKTLMRSADLSGMTELEEEEERKKREEKGDTEPKKLSAVAMGFVMAIAGALGVALAVMLFMWLPTMIFNLLKDTVNSNFGYDMQNFRALIEGVMKIIIFVCYLALVSQMKDIKRVFQYHGAEHKTIFCFEKGLDLTVENVRQQSRFHPRCGTSFMFLMIAVGIIFSTVIVLLFPQVAKYSYIWVPTKILLVPLFCGVGYEILKICGKHDNLFTKIVSAPGLWVQRLTTKEPEDQMIEVAIASIAPVLPNEEQE